MLRIAIVLLSVRNNGTKGSGMFHEPTEVPSPGKGNRKESRTDGCNGGIVTLQRGIYGQMRRREGYQNTPEGADEEVEKQRKDI